MLCVDGTTSMVVCKVCLVLPKPYSHSQHHQHHRSHTSSSFQHPSLLLLYSSHSLTLTHLQCSWMALTRVRAAKNSGPTRPPCNAATCSAFKKTKALYVRWFVC